MILLRAIPFSFNVLWRMVLVFPFMILALIVFGFIAAFFMLFASLIAPLVTVVIAIAFGVAASVLPVIVGCRLGLQAKEATMRNGYFGLVLPAIGYGLFEVFCLLLILAVGAGVYLLATPLTLTNLTQLAALDEELLIAQLMSVNPAVTLSVLWVGLVLAIGMRAALLMPFAGASIGADPSGRPHTPFYGFGREFISLLIIVAIAYVLSGFAVPIAVAICYMLGFGDSLTAALAQFEAAPSMDVLGLLGVETAVFLGLSLLFYLLAFSLQSAAGALAYMNELEDMSDQQNAFDMSMDEHLQTMTSSTAQPERPMQSEDVMELIRSRMQQRKE